MQRPASNRGIALIMVLMLVVVMLILVGSLLEFMPTELNAAAFTGYDDRALYAADSGIQYATESLENAAASGFFPTPAPMPAGVPFATVYLDPSPSPSQSPDAQVWIQATGSGPSTSLATYYITSIGQFRGGTHRIDAVVTQEPLNSREFVAKNNAAGNYFVSGLMSFDGPIYLEGASNPVNIQWYDNVAPVFGNTAEISGRVKWFGPSPSGTPRPAEWKFVDALGKGGVTFVPPNSLPFPTLTDSASVANEAYAGSRTGTTFPNPGPKGIYIDQHAATGPRPTDPQCGGLSQVDSGIFVQGDANISMSSTGTTQTFVFSPSGTPNQFSSDTFTVAIDFSANTTRISDKPPVGPTVVATYCGTPSGDPQSANAANGVVFVDGDVKALSGTVHGDYTIAVPDDTVSGSGAHDVILTGNITLQNDPNPANPGYCNCQSTDMLGIYAHDVLVSQKSIAGPAQFEAAIFAGNSADVTATSPTGSYMVQGAFSGVGRGTLNLFGSVVQNFIQPLGVFNPSSGRLVSGWADTYNWDRRFTQRVPPGMPESDKFDIVAWKDVGTP